MHRIFKRKLWKILGLLVLTGGVLAGLLLVKQSQDNRSRASSSDCDACDMCKKTKDYNDTHGISTTLSPSCVNACNSCAATGTGDGCKPPRHMQNGNCIGGVRGEKLKEYINQDKCKTDSDCKSGKHCALNVCY